MLIYQTLKVRDNIRMNMYQHRRERLLALIDAEYGGERVRFADKTGLSESRLAQLLSTTYREGTAFTEKTARKVEEAAGLPMMYFDMNATANVIPMDEFMRVRTQEAEDPMRTEIRKVRLQVQAGITGFQVEQEHYEGETASVPTDWLQQKGYRKDALYALVVKGESMEPSLHEGDVIVVNTADTKLSDGEVFVFNYEGEAVVKRASRDAGQWWLASDNADQRKYHRKLCKGGECIVIGKVVRKESIHI